jgi:type III secretory pathway component EscV
MKKDYLWDKTGEDPEIERLENALAVFRYQATEPPALPAKIIPFERKAPRSFFRFAFAFTSCAAAVAICLGIWLQFSNNKIEVAKDSIETVAPQTNEKVADTNPVEKSNDSITAHTGKIEIPKQSVERKVIKVKKVVQQIERQNNLIARKIEVKKPAVTLTKEEKYAYDQLMLALSITSSKFKMVKDKVAGIEEKDAGRENAR